MKYDFNLEDKSKKYKHMLVQIVITLIEIALVVSAAYAITHYGLEKMNISGDYMNPTLKDGDEVLVNKMSYIISSVKRNDVVVIKQEGSGHSYYSVARVMGLPGETVKIEDGYLYINGKQLEEKYNFPVMENGEIGRAHV